MKGIYLLALIVLGFILTTNAQTLIAVQNGGTPRFYSVLQDAITNAQNKDTIYIPGGAYSLTNSIITIDKELHLIGTGHYLDSTVVGITQLNAGIFLVSGANSSTFEGFYLNGSFYSGKSSTDEDVDDITISRCNCSSINLSKLSTGWSIRENVVRFEIRGLNISSNAPFAQGNSISNNIVSGQCSYFGPNNVFKNNIFLYNTIPFLTNIDGCIFRNNIFTNYSNSGVTSSIFENNLFYATLNVPSGNIGSNNISNQTSATTFVNQSGSSFSYVHDYHLKLDSPGKNAGKDGTDIGIYGGAFPWKEGSVPSNPHFQRVQISPKTDNNGNLNVKIKMAAQDH